MIQLRTLGRIDVLGSDGTPHNAVVAQPKRLALLAFLALASARGFVRRDTLVAMFWPDLDDEHARGALSQALRFLRRELGDDAFTRRGEEEIALDLSRVTSDVGAFDRAHQDSDHRRAIELYAGEFLDGLHVAQAPDVDQWLDSERRRLSLLYAKSLDAMSDVLLGAGDATGALVYLRKLVAQDPYNGAVAIKHMRALVAAGDRAGAIAHAGEHAERLASDLEAEPDPDVSSFAAHLRDNPDRGIGPPVAVAASRATTAPSGSDAPAPQIRAPRLRSAAILAVATVIVVVIAAPPLQQVWSRPNGDRPSAATASLASAARSQPSRPPGSEARPITSNPEAYSLLLRAAYALSKRTPPDLVNACSLIDRAIDLDPLYADAFAMKSQCLGGYAWYGLMRADEAFRGSEAAARHAIALDSTCGLAWAMLASKLSFFHYRWDEAEADFRRALALNPEIATSHNEYALYLRALGRFKEALAEERAAQSLDANYRHFSWAVGYVLTLAGRDSEAVVELRGAIGLDSTYTRPRFELVEALARLGRFDAAVRELSVALKIERYNEAAAVADTATSEPGYRAAVRWMGAARLKRLRDTQAHDKYVPPMQMADALLDAGDREGAITQIQLALEVRDPRLTYLNSPRYRAIVVDPRVRAVRRQMNLEGRR